MCQKDLLKVAKKLFTSEQDNVILDLFNRKKGEKLTNVFIENEFSRLCDCAAVSSKTLSKRYYGNLIDLFYK